MEYPSRHVWAAMPPQPGLPLEQLWVASELHYPDGQILPCPAAPVIAGMYERAGRTVSTGPLHLVDQVRLNGFQAAVAVLGADGDRGVGLAVGTRTTGPWLSARATLDTWARTMRPRTVLLAQPRSFCAGVERAIDVVERLLDQRGPDEGPLYVRKQIVHNQYVVDELATRGAVFVEELNEVPDGARVVFSAHGVSPQVRAEAERKHLSVVDATCPLVTKVHSEARRYAQRGNTVVLIGHAGHEETEGTLGEAPEATVLIETADDVATLEVPDPTKVTYLTQTTLAVDETAETVAALKARFPYARGPGAEDICYATTNRQHALQTVAAQVDLVLVLGSDNSSNSLRMVELARRAGCEAHLIEDASHIRSFWLEHAQAIGLSAGASAPPALVEDTIAGLKGLGPLTVEEHTHTTEDVYFAPPATLRNHT
ncbi:4-hydroxy-3-methylbut-2-enyl diphosphate reductase [Streptomyces monticola]|uniref:4-hydroxy-3-methylbut-2-enyl diphosphate reductase n=1 Tax=Streptomyces monticola TaxID=2666263 RepID=A0ABW2JSK9_9ACTN